MSEFPHSEAVEEAVQKHLPEGSVLLYGGVVLTFLDANGEHKNRYFAFGQGSTEQVAQLHNFANTCHLLDQLGVETPNGSPFWNEE